MKDRAFKTGGQWVELFRRLRGAFRASSVIDGVELVSQKMSGADVAEDLASAGRAFRAKMLGGAHPDHGGDVASFQRLLAARKVAESRAAQ